MTHETIGPSALTLDDLNITINHEPRIHDLALANRLGFTAPHMVRTLIDRNHQELVSYGEVFVTATKTSRAGGRPGREYWLNEGQALVICALSRTTNAAAVRKQIIDVYMAWRRGRERPAAPPLPPPPVSVRPHTRRRPLALPDPEAGHGTLYLAGSMINFETSLRGPINAGKRVLAVVKGVLGVYILASPYTPDGADILSADHRTPLFNRRTALVQVPNPDGPPSQQFGVVVGLIRDEWARKNPSESPQKGA